MFGQSDAFVTLAQLARENTTEAGRVVRGLALKPDAERRVLLDQVIGSFEAGGADRALIKALRLLKDDGVALKLREML